jgi:hypothetical protein
MSVTAQQLSKSGARGKELDGIINEQLHVIDAALQRAERTWGRNVVPVSLPTSFSSMLGLSKKDAQRIVYSSILKNLESRGFEVRLLMEMEPERTTLYMAWMTDLDKAELEAMTALIKAKRITRDKLDEFMAQGALKAPNAASEVGKGRAAPAPALSVKETDMVMQPRGGVGIAPSTTTRPAPTGPATKAEAAMLNL